MPTIGIGLPVYNGENYLPEALDSLLAQTWTDFELIICDNASTDGTEAICREYADRDRRINYRRNQENLGAADNFNLVFRLTSAPFFKWMAHDDVLSPEFLEVCLLALESDSQAVLACSRVSIIDENGLCTGNYQYSMRVGSLLAYERFADLINVRHPCTMVFGLIRREALEATGLIGDYTGSDRCLLAELALAGTFKEIPEFLFHRRDHPETSSRRFPSRRIRNAWFNPRRTGGIYLPEWRILGEYLRIIRRSDLSPAVSWRCQLQVAKIARLRWKTLTADALLGARDLLERSPAGRRVFQIMRRVGLDPYSID